jgi:hypothetical protein
MGFKDKFRKILGGDKPQGKESVETGQAGPGGPGGPGWAGGNGGDGGVGCGLSFQEFIDDERNKAIRTLLSGKEYKSEFEYGTREGEEFRVVFSIAPGKFADFDADPDNPPISYAESAGVGVMTLSITNAVPGAAPVTRNNCNKIISLLSGGPTRFTSSDLAEEGEVYGKAFILNFEYGD